MTTKECVALFVYWTVLGLATGMAVRHIVETLT